MTVVPFRLDKRAQQLRKLTEISRALTYAVSLSEVLDLTVQRAADLLAAERVVLMLTDEQELLRVRASYGLEKENLSEFHEPLHETLITRLRILLQTSEDEEFLGVPLVVGGRVTGLLAVAKSSQTSTELDDDEWLLSALADQAAVALEKTRLDETAEFRERLIGIVSHDLRNPISVILMATMALARMPQADQATVSKMVGRIHNAAERASAMVRDLLDFTQARLGGGIHVGRKPADMHAIVRQVVEEMEISHPSREFVVEHQGDARGEWDPDRLAQVASNLLSNAVSYSPASSPIRISTQLVGDDVSFDVHNEGAPITEELQPHLFEPMRRASAELSYSNRSVGLGLYIVKHIVEAHGGIVFVSSREGAGTRFTVQLPRSAKVLAPQVD